MACIDVMKFLSLLHASDVFEPVKCYIYAI